MERLQNKEEKLTSREQDKDRYDKNVIIDEKRGSIPRWHSSWWYGGRCRWKIRWQEWNIWWGKRGSMPIWHSSWWYLGRWRWKKDDKNERIDEEKEAACPYGTPPDDIEEGVGEKNWQ